MAKLQLLGEAPVPSVNQRYVTQSTRFGWVMKPYKKPKEWAHLVSLKPWEQWTKKPIVQINRDLLKYLAETWRTTLTQSSRDAWAAAAAGASWTNYYGHAAYHGGFELWMAVQRDRQYWKFWPWLTNANIAKSYRNVPPDPWAPAPAPHVYDVLKYDDAWTIFYIDNNPDTTYWMILTLVSQAPGATGPGRPKRYLVCPNLAGPDPPHNNNVSIPLEYPHYPAQNGPAARLKVGIRFFNWNTMNISPATWTAI